MLRLKDIQDSNISSMNKYTDIKYEEKITLNVYMVYNVLGGCFLACFFFLILKHTHPPLRLEDTLIKSLSDYNLMKNNYLQKHQINSDSKYLYNAYDHYN